MSAVHCPVPRRRGRDHRVNSTMDGSRAAPSAYLAGQFVELPTSRDSALAWSNARGQAAAHRGVRTAVIACSR
jgi:hypothetical protein